MSTQVQFRRGTTTQNNAFTGAAGEISVDTDVKTLRLHDGTTAGGGAIIVNSQGAQTLLNKTHSTGSVWNGSAVPMGYGGTGSSLTAAAGALPYSTANGMGLSSVGSSGQLLSSGGSGSPTWISASTLTVGTATVATTATNIAGGSAGQLMIQADTGLTSFIAAGATGTFLQSAGAGYAPTWAAGQVTFGSTTVALGAASTSLAGLTAINATSGSTSFFATPTSPSLFAAGTAITIGATTGSTTVRNNLTITGNLVVNGTTITVNSSSSSYTDSIMELHNTTDSSPLISDDGKDIGIRFHYFKTSDKNSFVGMDNATLELEYIVDGTETNGVFAGTPGTFRGRGFNHQDLFLHDSFTATTTGTSANTIYSFPFASYRTGEFTMQVKNGSAYRVVKLMVVTDGTTATASANYLTDSELQTATTNTTLTATVSGSNVLIQATVSSGVAVIKGSATLFTA